jgi:hypothetical protein
MYGKDFGAGAGEERGVVATECVERYGLVNNVKALFFRKREHMVARDAQQYFIFWRRIDGFIF